MLRDKDHHVAINSIINTIPKNAVPTPNLLSSKFQTLLPSIPPLPQFMPIIAQVRSSNPVGVFSVMNIACRSFIGKRNPLTHSASAACNKASIPGDFPRMRKLHPPHHQTGNVLCRAGRPIQRVNVPMWIMIVVEEEYRGRECRVPTHKLGIRSRAPNIISLWY